MNSLPSNQPANISPAELYWTIYAEINSYHLSPSKVLTEPPQQSPNFASDDDVINHFHHLFEESGDPYSRIVVTGASGFGTDIDPESDDTTPDITYTALTAEIGLIRINQFRFNDCAEKFIAALAALSKCKSIILDLRNNPGGKYEETIRIAESLVAQGNFGGRLVATPDGFKSRDYQLEADALVTWSADLDGSNKTSQSEPRLPDVSNGKQIAVLINENSRSTAEILSCILQENGRAKLIGKRTFGKGRGTSILEMPNGLELQVLGSYWFTPSGKCLGTGPDDPDKGIAPDYEISEVATAEGEASSNLDDPCIAFAMNMLTASDGSSQAA